MLVSMGGNDHFFSVIGHRAIISSYLIIFRDQTDDGEEMGRGVAKKSRYAWLKAVCAAVLLPGFGVPITKWVEGYYDVSFFSPSITAFWNVIQSFGYWLVRDVTVSFWVLSLLCVGSFLLLLLFLIFLYSNFFEKSTASWKTLTEDQKLAFAVVGEAIQNSRQIGHENVRQLSGLSVIATRTALDVLFHYELIRAARDPWGNSYLDLTFRGQQQYLELSSVRIQ